MDGRSVVGRSRVQLRIVGQLASSPLSRRTNRFVYLKSTCFDRLSRRYMESDYCNVSGPLCSLQGWWLLPTHSSPGNDGLTRSWQRRQDPAPKPLLPPSHPPLSLTHSITRITHYDLSCSQDFFCNIYNLLLNTIADKQLARERLDRFGVPPIRNLG